MEMPYCDVIGCGSHAQWFLISEREDTVEEQNLCQGHWRQLMADRSRRVIRWSRATPVCDPAPDAANR
jgi:hypothetical protein